MKKLLLLSFALTLLSCTALFLLLQRLGGWRYALNRLQHNETGLYAHRKQLFERLPERPGAILFVGDSQTEQCEWSELIAMEGPPVLNRGITGDHTAGISNRLPELLRHRPSKMFLMVGVNDLLFDTPLLEIAARYRSLVQQIRSRSPNTQLVLLGLPSVNNQIKQTGLTTSAVDGLNTKIAQIAKEYALPFVDLKTPLSDAEGRLSAKFTEDGLHLNALAYLVWKQGIAAYLGVRGDKVMK